ncbi:ead/Ea22-like family protein [Klebsiella aerogenes]|uniref:ead/Ea22-like family protein n=1 Tax=Klebsiella aerogenes TaxID=548 RepID=UPI00300DBA46
MTSDITELAQRMKAAAEKASNGDWVKESGDGWEACCSANDQANGGFIIAHFEGPDAAENRAFVQAANPANILALVEALEKAQGMEAYWKTQCRGITDHCEELQARIAELESRTVTVRLPKRSVGEVMHMSGFSRDYAEGWCAGNDNAIHQICNTQGIKWEAE